MTVILKQLSNMEVAFIINVVFITLTRLIKWVNVYNLTDRVFWEHTQAHTHIHIQAICIVPRLDPIYTGQWAFYVDRSTVLS